MGCAMQKPCLWAYADSEGLYQPKPSTQADQGLPCLLTESLDATECINGELRPA